MRVVETRVYRGPSPYGYRPVIRLTVDLEELEQYPSGELPNFNARLVELFRLYDGAFDRLHGALAQRLHFRRRLPADPHQRLSCPARLIERNPQAV